MATCYHYLNWDCPICNQPIRPDHYIVKKIGKRFMKIHVECADKVIE